ncbi:MAG: hypothetical protein H7099_03795 [Gemmatimonadaceae bacterium]|nr:hypothetical protein [Gemmatimonadaceae bacterium]
MTNSVPGTTLRRLAVVIGVTLASAPILVAQSPFASSAAQPKQSIEELTTQWASLELPLLGISDLTDLQRDAIELLEGRFRTLFNEEAGPIRAARVTLYQRGPFERQNVERALERMGELRRRELALTRSMLTETQRVRYDANLRQIAAQEADANTKRDREAAFFTP